MVQTRVKFLSKTTLVDGVEDWRRRLPGGGNVWGNCRFEFDPDEPSYDWLLVYEDLPSDNSVEEIACDPRNTILVTSEPSSIKRYGKTFLGQFGHVITSQEPWAISHPGVLRQQSGMVWLYATGERGGWDAVSTSQPRKTQSVSTVCSAKKSGLTLHRQRFRFTERLQQLLPELELYGTGIRRIDTKADAIDPFRYHVAVENHVAPHHFTEKLIDGFLGWSLPVYYGASRVFDYFPEDSVVPVDIEDPEAAADTIRRLIRDCVWESRLDAIREARRRVLEEYHLFALVDQLVSRPDAGEVPAPNTQTLISRHELRRRSVWVKFESILEKSHATWKNVRRTTP